MIVTTDDTTDYEICLYALLIAVSIYTHYADNYKESIGKTPHDQFHELRPDLRAVVNPILQSNGTRALAKTSYMIEQRKIAIGFNVALV